MVATGRSQARLPPIWLAVLLPCVARASLFRHMEAESADVQEVFSGVQQEYAGVEQVEEFDVLTTIQTEVNMMNDNLQRLSEALDGLTTPSPPTTTPPTTTSQPTETTSLASTMEESTTTMATTETDTVAPTTTPTTTSPTTTTAPTTTAAPTTTPSTTSTTQATSAETSASTSQPTSASEATSPSAPTTTPASSSPSSDNANLRIEEQTPSPRQVRVTRSEGGKPLRLFVSKRNDETCGPLSDIAATLDAATSALNRVTASQLDNTTIDLLQESNTALNFTTSCIERGDITPGDTAAVQASLSAAVKSGAEATDTIDAIVSPPTQAPEEDGFRAATIALGVLFSLAVVALIGMGIYTSRQNSGGHIS